MSSRLERRSSVMEYEQSVIFGQYHEKLATFARLQTRKTQKERFKEDVKVRKKGLSRAALTFLAVVGNWPLLFFLGITIAFLSFAVDVTTSWLVLIRGYALSFINPHDVWSGYLIWTSYSVILVMISATVTRYVSPQAAGSGVAEMKVIIRGVVIKEYLSFRTLIAKVVGVPFILASGLGLGKEGPFVHISSLLTNQFFKIFGKVTTTPNEYETRFQELITIAAAVGVAATFAAPIGSVLYSIEIVKSFFAVRSYWEGFFAATWGALLWRLFGVWFNTNENISHLLLTEFRKSYPYESLEICCFALLGVLCGLISYLFVQFQRSIVMFNRKKTFFSDLLARFPLLYPLIVSLFIASVKYPKGIGQFTSAHISMEESMHELFSNFTWHTLESDYWQSYHDNHNNIGHHGTSSLPLINSLNMSVEQMLHDSPSPSSNINHDAQMAHEMHIISNWTSTSTSIFWNTFLFVVSNFITVALAATVPVPGGLIVPLFMVGAGLGRCFGEIVAYLFPHGLNPNGMNVGFEGVIPGAYAVAASAALCGGITGSLSVAVIAFEITGQLTHFLPVIVCVLCSNLVSRYLGPTIYESTIELKNLPFLPTMIKASAVSHRVLVEDFMDTDVQFVWNGCTYQTLNNILHSHNLLAFYPFVSSPDSKFLLGIIHHLEIKSLMESHLNKSIKSLHGSNGNTLKSYKDISKSDTQHKDNNNPETISPQVTFNGRFQIWSNFGPYKISYLNKEIYEKKMTEIVDFTSSHIDPAPLQIMEGTPLSNIHNLFSLLSLQVVYVTSLGRLTGVVSLKDLRNCIENVEKGNVPSKASVRNTHNGDIEAIAEESEPLKEIDEEDDL